MEGKLRRPRQPGRRAGRRSAQRADDRPARHVLDQTSWPHGGTFALTAVLISALSSTSPNPGRLSLQLTLGTSPGPAPGCSYCSTCYPTWTVSRCCSAACCRSSRSAPCCSGGRSGTATASAYWCGSASPRCRPTWRATTLAFFNEYLALLLSMVLATVAAMVILPPNRPWMWKRLEHDLRERVVFAISGKSRAWSPVSKAAPATC